MSLITLIPYPLLIGFVFERVRGFGLAADSARDFEQDQIVGGRGVPGYAAPAVAASRGQRVEGDRRRRFRRSLRLDGTLPSRQYSLCKK